MHSLWVNYQARIWNQADISYTEIAKPSFHGWTKSVNGVLSIDHCIDLFPLHLFDILYDNQNINEEQEQTDYDFDEDIDKVQFEFEDSYE